MPTIVKGQGDFEQPPTGMIRAVCVFVNDIGTHISQFMGEQTIARKMIVSWELDEKMTKGEYAGKPFMMNRFYTMSLAKKANLRKDLESWRGRPFTDEELKGFDVEKLIGANCYLNLMWNEANDKVVIKTITQLPKGVERMIATIKEPSETYLAWIARERAKSTEMQGTPQHADNGEAPPRDDPDGAPF